MFLRSAFFLAISTFSLYSNISNDKFIVLTVLYNEKHAQRIEEYKECIEKNVAHGAVESVHVIYDTTRDDDHTPLLDYLKAKGVQITYYSGGRPSFQYCFNLANKYHPNEKILLINADIYFDESLNRLLPVDISDCLLVLTRWDLFRKKAPSLLYINGDPNEMSQDVWIFQTPIRDIDCEHLRLGTPHCEGQLALAAHNAGLSLYNPCLSIKAYHVHFSRVRHWRDIPIPSNRISVPWCRLEDTPLIY